MMRLAEGTQEEEFKEVPVSEVIDICFRGVSFCAFIFRLNIKLR